MPHHSDFEDGEPSSESSVEKDKNSYGLAILFVTLIILFGVGFLVSVTIPEGNEVVDVPIVLTPSAFDGNFTEEHIELASNQQFILTEIQKLNLYSQCQVQTIEPGQLPLDDRGAFQRVSVVTLVCPEIQGESNT